jgi:hypothetical protein
MMLPVELRSKAIEAMRGISSAGEEDQRPARAAPIQDLKPNAWLDRDKLYGMRRVVGWILRVQFADR